MIENKLKSIFDRKFKEIENSICEKTTPYVVSNKCQEYLKNLCEIDERITKKSELLALVIPCEQNFIRVNTLFGCIEMPIDFCLKVIALDHLP